MKLRKCPACNLYTFNGICRNCNGATVSPHPPKYSPEDKYGSYRRKVASDLAENSEKL